MVIEQPLKGLGTTRRRLRPKANEETQLKQLAKYRRNNPALEFYSVEQAPNARAPASQGSRARGQSLNPTQSKVQRAAGAPPGRLSCFGRARNKRRTAGKHLFKEPSPLRPSSLRRWHSPEDGVASGERWRVTTGEPRRLCRGSLVFSTHSNVGAGKSPRSAGSAQPDSGRTPTSWPQGAALSQGPSRRQFRLNVVEVP
jgi:hypothetical protein